MRILAIDTSCDDTAIALLEVEGKKSPQFRILANVVSSQIKIHKKYGGVYPALAKREHQRNLIPVLKKVLKKSNLLNSKFKIQNAKLQSKIQNLNKILEREPFLLRGLKKFLFGYQKPDIDLIAVTVGPGLEPCLWQGVNFAKALSFFWKLPAVPINHIEAHIFANFVGKKLKSVFPAICLVVSGGHTQLILMRGFGKYKILGETRDDAAGEAFDKTARILGLDYPGGPAIAALAAQFSTSNSQFSIKLPRPMIYSKDYDFSFSGLKTAVLYDYKKRSPKEKKSKKYIRAMAKEIQQAIVDVLIKKTIKAAKNFRVKTIILGGGVGANEELRKQLKEKVKSKNLKVNLLMPPKNLCTDNAQMVATLAYFYFKMKKFSKWDKIKAEANLKIGQTL
jgi:N6-L-threonylcarbamoyladenine synthase